MSVAALDCEQTEDVQFTEGRAFAMRRSGPAGVRHVEPDAPKPRRLRDGRYTLVNLFTET